VEPDAVANGMVFMGSPGSRKQLEVYMTPLLFEKCRDYLLAHAVSDCSERNCPPLRAVTLSRETGAGAITIGRLVADHLEAKLGCGAPCKWCVFDRNLVKAVLKEHKLPETIERYMPEGAVNSVHDVLEELLGVHPPSWTLLQHTNHTILKLATAGNVILVGRGAHLVTAHLPHVFHVRLVAPLDLRIRHVEDYYHLGHQEAAAFVRKTDRARERYIRRSFGARVQDPLQFHMIINTGKMGFPEAARLIGDAVLNTVGSRPR